MKTDFLRKNIEKYYFDININNSTKETIEDSIVHQNFIESLRLLLEKEDYISIGKELFNYHHNTIDRNKIDSLLNSKNEDLKLLNDFWKTFIFAFFGSDMGFTDIKDV